MKGKPLVNVQIRAEQEVSELFDNTLTESDIPTRGRFLELLLEKFLNPKTVSVEVSKPEDVQLIQSLSDYQIELQKKVDELTANNQQLQTAVAQSGVIPPGNILFQVTESELQVIDQMKPWLKQQGFEETNELALYTAIRFRKIIR